MQCLLTLYPLTILPKNRNYNMYIVIYITLWGISDFQGGTECGCL